MVYGADRIVQMPVMQLYDTGLMQSAINNARYMYDKAEKRMDDFYEKYDNFYTPIQRDQDWYNENVIGKFRKGIDELYARGEDPLRTASGRAKLAQLARSIDVGTVNKLRTSADNAREFLKERSRLEAAGLYNPLLAKYDGPNINSYSTLESGAWDKMSPTKIVDMATFGNPYYEGMKPNVHKASKNGISYSIESITPEDLEKIANDHYNELVSTAQGQLMYKYYKDMYGSDDLARDAFNKAVAAGQTRRVYQKDDYEDNWAQRQQISQGWARINQAKREFEFQKKMYEDSLNNPEDIRPRGAADQVKLDQTKQFVAQKEEYAKQLSNEEKLARKAIVDKDKENNSTGGQKLIEVYKKLDKISKNEKIRKESRERALKEMEKLETGANTSNEFKNWVKAYRNQEGIEAGWAKKISSVSSGYDGRVQPEENLYNKAHESFTKHNIIQDSVDDGMQQDMNHSLALRKDGDDAVGVIGTNTKFAPVAEAEFTGNRVYKHDSFFSKLNRLIKGKEYKVTLANQGGRGYGHGLIGNVSYDVITQIGTFDDDDIKTFFSGPDGNGGYTIDGLRSLGITQNNDGSWNIPLVSRFSSGSQTWGNVNTETHRRNNNVKTDAAIEVARAMMRPTGGK